MAVNISVDKLIENIFFGFRKVTPMLLAIDVTAGFILFAPNTLLNAVYLSDLHSDIMRIIGIIFVVSTFLLMINLFSYVLKKLNKKASIRHLEKQLENLTFMEKKMITMLYYSPSNTMLMSLHGQTKGALELKKIIIQTTNISSDIGCMTFSYMLQPWVLNYIRKNPAYLVMTQEEFKNEYKIYYHNLDNGESY